MTKKTKAILMMVMILAGAFAFAGNASATNDNPGQLYTTILERLDLFQKGEDSGELQPHELDNGEEGDGLLLGESNTRCDTLNTVCATAVASSFVECDSVSGLRFCKGGSGIGGHGASPVGLPGQVDWDGFSNCSMHCAHGDTERDTLTWPGGGRNGAGSSAVIGHPEESAFLGCVRYSVTSGTQATAAAQSDLGTTQVRLINVIASANSHESKDIGC